MHSIGHNAVSAAASSTFPAGTTDEPPIAAVDVDQPPTIAMEARHPLEHASRRLAI